MAIYNDCDYEDVSMRNRQSTFQGDHRPGAIPNVPTKNHFAHDFASVEQITDAEQEILARGSNIPTYLKRKVKRITAKLRQHNLDNTQD